MLSNRFRDRENLRAKGFGVLHLDPRAIAKNDDTERRPHPVLLFDEEKVDSELKLVAIAHPFRGFPLFRDERLTVPHDTVRAADEFEPLREERHVIESDRRSHTQTTSRPTLLRDNDEEQTQESQDESDTYEFGSSDFHLDATLIFWLDFPQRSSFQSLPI